MSAQGARRRSWQFVPDWLISPASRVASGLVALMVMLLLMLNMFTGGLVPDTTAQARREHTQVMQLVVNEVVLQIQTLGVDQLQLARLLTRSMQKHPQIQSAALQLHDGDTIATDGHAARWRLANGESSTLENMRSLLSLDDKPWGELQLSFAPARPAGILGWMRQPLVLGFLALALLGFASFYLYLRRTMVYLDPSQVVPGRVRTALDTLAEGVLVLDVDERVMLVNRAFDGMRGDHDTLIGQPIGKLAWLTDAIQAQGVAPPWERALRHNQPQVGLNLQLPTPGGVLHAVMNCSPINDGDDQARGCLVTLADVTILHERTERLSQALKELEASREEIRRKNDELIVLATRDPLTGCLNRRAFSAESAALIDAATRDGTTLCCVMCDIDHFKHVNDTYGHAGGDVVLQAAAKLLGGALRAGDLLARLGGEEFCILLSDISLPQAREITERLRANVESHLGQALREHKGARVTMSFGVVQLEADRLSINAAINLADQALYHSKQNGRNRVTAYEDMAEISA